MTESAPLRATAHVNLAALERNARRLQAGLTGPAVLGAVVKANGYGHGAEAAARSALAGGARWLAVATAAEAGELRDAGVTGRLLVMGALEGAELGVALDAGAEIVAWDARFVAEVARRARGPVRLHVKLDTGMGRLGTRDEAEALALAAHIVDLPGVELAGVMTHFATSDDDEAFMAEQLARFEPFAARARSLRGEVVVHAANSAATLLEPRTHFDLVRCGIALYGCDPMHVDPVRHGLEPALSLRSYVAAVKRARPGESAGYGRRFVADRETLLGTIPIGYGDGLRRAFTNNLEVLVGGRRYPLVGTVSMDNITVDLGPEAAVRVGDPVTLIGRDGEAQITAEELARRIGTISYEIVCGISSRVPRLYHRDGEPA